MYLKLNKPRLKGQASIEYLVVCAALLAALLTPIDNNNNNVLELCSDAARDWYSAFAYSKSLSALPN